MTAGITTPFSSSQEGRSHRVPRCLAAPRDELAAASIQVGGEVQQLVDDLTALVDAGLIEPVYRCGELRFEAVEPEDSVA
jgi:hypothetical protein